MSHDYAYGIREEGGVTVPLATWGNGRILPETSASARSTGQVVAYDERRAFDPDVSAQPFSINFEILLARYDDPDDRYEDRSNLLRLFSTTRVRKYLVRTAPFQGTVEIPFVLAASPTSTEPRHRLQFTLATLEPYWQGALVSAANPVPSLSPAGDAPVRDAVLTFSAGTDQLLTNTLTGDSIQIEGSTATPIVVDVGARTVTQGGSSAISSVEFGGPRWFTFEPESNTCSLTGGGSVAVDYRPKWR